MCHFNLIHIESQFAASTATIDPLFRFTVFRVIVLQAFQQVQVVPHQSHQ